MIPISATSTDERLPVVVEGFDSAGGWPMRAESHDLVPAFVEGVVQAAERNDGSVLCSTEDALEADLEVRARGGVQHLAQLLLDLIGTRQRSVVGEQEIEIGALLARRILPCAQEQPAFAAANAAKLGAGTEEDIPPEFIEARVGSPVARWLMMVTNLCSFWWRRPSHFSSMPT